VLGLIDEWQIPNAGIAWDEAAATKYFEKLGWSAFRIREQVFKKFPPTLPRYRSFDPQSVMCYPIPPGLTTNGVVVGFNNDLSDSDKSFIAFLYPGPTPPEEITPGRVFERVITNPRQTYVHTIPNLAPGRYTFEIKGPVGIQARLHQVDQPGPEPGDVRATDDGGMIRLMAPLPGGTYRLDIEPKRLDATGTYSVRIIPA
jgi:hypothetical protein